MLPVTLVLVGLLLALGEANVTVSRYDYERRRNDAALASSPAAALASSPAAAPYTSGNYQATVDSYFADRTSSQPYENRKVGVLAENNDDHSASRPSPVYVQESSWAAAETPSITPANRIPPANRNPTLYTPANRRPAAYAPTNRNPAAYAPANRRPAAAFSVANSSPAHSAPTNRDPASSKADRISQGPPADPLGKLWSSLLMTTKNLHFLACPDSGNNLVCEQDTRQKN